MWIVQESQATGTVDVSTPQYCRGLCDFAYSPVHILVAALAFEVKHVLLQYSATFCLHMLTFAGSK